MAQYPIPQFIESEGKIISFLTFRQFFILIGAGAICLISYYLLPFYLFVLISIIVGLLAAMIAFLKIDNVSVMTLLLNYIMFTGKSKNYVWKKKESPYPYKFKENPVAADEALKGNTLKDAKQIVEFRKRKDTAEVER